MRATFNHSKNKAFLGFLSFLGAGLLLLGPQPAPDPTHLQEKTWMSDIGPHTLKSTLPTFSPHCTLASQVLTVPQASPIGGYLWPRSSKGPSNIQMGVLLIGTAPQQIAIMSAEILLVTPHLAQMIKKRFANLGIHKTLFTATHTHSGPGGFGHEGLEKIVLGQDQDIETRLVNALAQALQKALTQPMQPMSIAQARTNVLLRRTQSTEKLDDRIGLIQCGPNQLWVMHPAHPVTEENDERIHGDWPQLLIETLKTQGFSEVLYASSSGGEVSLARPKGREHTVKRMVKKKRYN